MTLTIYHNPRCTKSGQTLQLIEAAGEPVNIIMYLEAPMTVNTIKDILNKLGLVDARDLMRRNEPVYKELELKTVKDQKTLFQAMIDYPKLIERPIVVKGPKAIIGRPPENVKVLLNNQL